MCVPRYNLGQGPNANFDPGREARSGETYSQYSSRNWAGTGQTPVQGGLLSEKQFRAQQATLTKANKGQNIAATASAGGGLGAGVGGGNAAAGGQRAQGDMPTDNTTDRSRRRQATGYGATNTGNTVLTAGASAGTGTLLGG